MDLSRREILALGTGAFAASLVAGVPVFASLADEAITALTGGAETSDAGITLTAPEIAENGNTVPISVEAPGATSITVFADGNPVPAVASFAFGALAASQTCATRIRLATSQNVIAVAQMADGSWSKVAVPVKVTIGGCGG